MSTSQQWLTPKEKKASAAIIALHQNGLTCKEIATKNIAPERTIYQIIKNFKERGSTAVKKSSGCPRVSSKRLESPPEESATELCLQQYRARSGMAAGWCESICTDSEAKTFGRWPDVKKGSKEAFHFTPRKTVKDRMKFCRKYKDWTAEDWCKVIFSDEAPFRLFGTSGKSNVWRRKGECYHESCVVLTVKHPETIHVWGCFSTKGVGSLIILPKTLP
ncbi:hypothetical protein cypCar_00046661 [Cyprinus carpio]|nr:hypothetical protein cypCar_00046661 [Cyprinus carpio]